jgi:uncharacterized protein YjbI with pentapeptide repeats
MALEVGENYLTNHNQTTVTQGEATPEQQAWWNENSGQPIDEITHLTLTPAQELYLALCKNGFKLKEALDSCGFKGKKAAEAQQALKIRDDDGIVTEITRPSFVGADLRGRDLQGVDLQHADLRDAQMQGAVLLEANLKDADLRGAQMQGADLRWANLEGANLRGAKLRYANLYEADLSLTDVSGVDFDQNKDTHNANNLNTVILTNAFYDATNPPKNLPDTIKGKLLALDERSYKEAIRLQKSYQNALFSDNRDAFAAAEWKLTDYLGMKAAEAAKKAASEAVEARATAALKDAMVGMAISHYSNNPQQLSFTVTGALTATAAAPSGGDIGVLPESFLSLVP